MGGVYSMGYSRKSTTSTIEEQDLSSTEDNIHESLKMLETEINKNIDEYDGEYKDNLDKLSSSEKNELNKNIKLQLMYRTMANMIIKTYTITDYRTAYLLISNIFCPMIKDENSNVRYDFIKFIKKELDNFEPDANIKRKNIRDIYLETIAHFNLPQDKQFEKDDIKDMDASQKTLLNNLHHDMNEELFEFHVKIDRFKLQKTGLVLYIEYETRGIFDSIDEVREYCLGESIFPVFCYDLENNIEININ
jgi:hypothetical protein